MQTTEDTNYSEGRRQRRRSGRADDSGGPVRRSRRLSRGSSVEPSDDEGGASSCSVANTVVTSSALPALQTIREQSESPLKKPDIIEKADSLPSPEKKSARHPTPPPVQKEEASGEVSEVRHQTEEKDSPKKDPVSDTPVPDQPQTVTSGDKSADVNKTEEATPADDKKAASKPEEAADDEEDKTEVIDTVELTLHTGETLDKFDDSDEEENDPPPPAKSRRRSRLVLFLCVN